MVFFHNMCYNVRQKFLSLFVLFLSILFLFVCIFVFYFRYNLKKLTYDERKQKLIERLNALNAAAGANDDSDDEDEE